MADNRWHDGTFKDEANVGSRQRQEAAGVNGFDSEYNARTKIRMHEESQASFAAQQAEVTELIGKNLEAMYAAAGKSDGTPLYGPKWLALVPAAGACLAAIAAFMFHSQHETALAQLSAMEGSGQFITASDRPGSTLQAGDFENQIRSLLSRPSESTVPVLVSYCTSPSCAMPSSAALMEHVYPLVRKDKNSQQRFLELVCGVDNRYVLAPTSTGCKVENFSELKPSIDVRNAAAQQEVANLSGDVWKSVGAAVVFALFAIGAAVFFPRLKFK